MADSHFNCWATMADGVLRRVEVVACCHEDALRAVFAYEPRAIAVSCRSSTTPREERRHG